MNKIVLGLIAAIVICMLVMKQEPKKTIPQEIPKKIGVLRVSKRAVY